MPTTRPTTPRAKAAGRSQTTQGEREAERLDRRPRRSTSREHVARAAVAAARQKADAK